MGILKEERYGGRGGETLKASMGDLEIRNEWEKTGASTNWRIGVVA